MPLADTPYIRLLTGLPEQVPDDEIIPHLESANRELAGWIGEYEDSTDQEKLDRCKEAEACLTMFYILPILNTFFTDGVPGLQKELGEMEFLFHTPDDIEKIQKYWYDRAQNAVAQYRTGEAGDTGNIKWAAV